MPRRRYRCPIDGKKFPTPASLDRHMRVVHNKSIFSINSPGTFDKIITIKIDEYSYEELRELAAKQGISLSQFVRTLIYVGIASHKKGRKIRLGNT